jgi:hypothetical protein
MVQGVQQAPQAPSYAPAGIQVPANIATPEATMNSVKDQQSQLNAVNNLTSGGGRRHKQQQRHRGKTQRKGRRASFIRTYKGRKYQQSGGASQTGGEAIPIPQVGPICNGGPQCSATQNAAFTSIENQGKSNSINDGYLTGGRRRHKKVRFTHGYGHGHEHPRSRRHSRRQYSLLSTATYKLKKIIDKVFS